MEDNFEEKSLLSPDFELTQTAKSYLRETAKWGTFLGIIGFIFTGLIALAALFAGSAFSTMGSMYDQGFGSGMAGLITVIYLLGALLYFFPSYYLYQSSSKIKEALRTQDSSTLELALGKQKSFFKFWGIMTIVIMCIYGLAFIGGIGAAAFA